MRGQSKYDLFTSSSPFFVPFTHTHPRPSVCLSLSPSASHPHPTPLVESGYYDEESVTVFKVATSASFEGSVIVVVVVIGIFICDIIEVWW